MDTIFAFASGDFGRSAVAVLRLSGASSGAILIRLTGRDLPPPRKAVLRRLYTPSRTADSGEALDEALVLWMPAPASFTGEDCVELHLHGGPAIRAAMLSVLSKLDGTRAAEPGEFTRRAFLNGRLDLSAVEGLADLIDAETEAQRRQAMSQLQGAFSRAVSSWRSRLLDRLALLEASLDFADEDDIPDIALEEVARELTEVEQEIANALAGAARGERIRDGYRVVIAGPPNAGKSTLLNAIARREVAIVSPIAGTTRDVIEIRCDLDGVPVILADTAGLRDTGDEVERIGVERARAQMGEADLVLWLAPADAEPDMPPGSEGGAFLLVRTKSDLAGGEAAGLPVSALSGAGMDALFAEILRRLGGRPAGEPALATRERHRAALREAQSCLVRAGAALHNGATELVAEDVRLALRAIGRIVGAVDVEEVLDRVFAQFCIGK